VAADQRKAINRFQFHANGNDWPCTLFRVDLNQALDFSLTPPEKEPGSSRNCRKSSGSFIAMDVDRHLALVIMQLLDSAVLAEQKTLERCIVLKHQ